MVRKRREIVLLSLMLQFSIRPCFSGCSEGAQFTKVEFHKLEGRSFQMFAFHEDYKCFFKCGSSPWCLSLNIADQPNKDGLYECVVLREVTSQSLGLLRPSQVFHHYTRRVNKCDSSTCMNGGTCETLVNDFFCHCPQRFTGILCENLSCNTSTPLGMESGAIVNSSISASSFLTVYEPHHARLNDNSEWTSKTNDVNQWFQVDLRTVTKVTGIATQGSQNNDEWITSYSLQHSLDPIIFFDYEEGKTFMGNTDDSSVVKHHIDPAITTRYIRVRPKTWKSRISLRMELYGCR